MRLCCLTAGYRSYSVSGNVPMEKGCVCMKFTKKLLTFILNLTVILVLFSGCAFFQNNKDGIHNLRDIGSVFILGDSYSTFQGHIPATHLAYYSESEDYETGVDSVEKTWWHRLIKTTGAQLVMNSSWSGTTICNTDYSGPDSPNSFIRRIDHLARTEYFVKNQIDTVFVMGGQNDDWAGAPIGELKLDNWTEEDLLQYGPAVCYLMHCLKTELPDARIIFVINSDMKKNVIDYQIQAAKVYGLEYIQLENIIKVNGHPTTDGMAQIEEQILAYLDGCTS